ncbi:hypothetical protein KCU79_g98, partial [Aureobasidium melanogenum]
MFKILQITIQTLFVSTLEYSRRCHPYETSTATFPTSNLLHETPSNLARKDLSKLPLFSLVLEAIHARSFRRPSNLPLVPIVIKFPSTLFKCEKVLLVRCTPNALQCTSLNQGLGGWYSQLGRSIDDDESVSRECTSDVERASPCKYGDWHLRAYVDGVIDSLIMMSGYSLTGTAMAWS